VGIIAPKSLLPEMNLHFRNALVLATLISTLSLGLIGVVDVRAQKPMPAVTRRPFEPAEELFYEAEFSRSLIRKLDVADFRFSATRTPVSGPSKNSNDQAGTLPYALTFNAEIASKGFFTRLFNLNFRELVESTVEPLTFTVQKTTTHDEQGKRIRTSEATFDQVKGKVIWTQRDPNDPGREPRRTIADFSGQLQDVLSAIYFIRTQPLEVGKSFEIFIGDRGRIYRVPIRVVEKKRMKTILGRVNVIRVDPDLFGPDGMVGADKGEFSIWLTDDNRHIPVGGRVQTEYGTFDIKLKKMVSNHPS
jgi:hypothetical protein